MAHDLLLAVQVDGGAHEDQRGVQLVIVAVVFLNEGVWTQNNFVKDALFLSQVVDWQVTENAEWKLSNFLILFFENALDVATIKDFTELLDQADVEKRFDSQIAEGDIAKSFK